MSNSVYKIKICDLSSTIAEEFKFQRVHISLSIMNHEKLLAIFYPLVVACGFICSVTTAVAWSHWKYVLNTCVPTGTDYYNNERNCGCILKGLSTITYFIGGHYGYCIWATFGLLLPMFVAIIFGCYHVWRVCFGVRGRRHGQHTVRQR